MATQRNAKIKIQLNFYFHTTFWKALVRQGLGHEETKNFTYVLVFHSLTFSTLLNPSCNLGPPPVPWWNVCMTGQVSIYFTIGCFTSLSKTKIMQQLLLEKLLVRALHFDWLIALVKQKTHFLPFIVLHLKCFNYIFYNIFNIFMYLWYLNSPPHFNFLQGCLDMCPYPTKI